MKIFCFLGNTGKKYEKTRHNVGFLFGDFLQTEWGFSEWKNEKKMFGETSDGTHQLKENSTPEKIIFLKPHTFMNLSGKSLDALMRFYKVSAEDITIFYDDKDLDFSILRFRKKGSAGGHNGIKDIIRVLGSQEFSRWKIGVDSPIRLKMKDTADFVLSNFSASAQQELNEKIFPTLAENLTQ